MLFWRPPIPVVARLFAGLLFLSQAGCMSALTTVAMREALRETIDSLAEASSADAPLSGQDTDAAVKVAKYEAADEPAAVISEQPQPQPLSLDEAVERAVARLKVAGELDAPTQATLLSILEATRPEDWPAAIDAFAASLEAHRPIRPQATAAEPATVAVALEPPTTPSAGPEAEPTLAFPAPPHVPEEPARITVSAAARPIGPAPNPGADDAPASPPAAVLELVGATEPLPDATASADSQTLAADEPPSASAQATLAVRNACFVSRVRAWGVVDQFSEPVFRPGQDVIVYFELDAPTARQASAGHTTSIDTDFRMIAPDGGQVGHWNFDPIDETSHAPRRDYFARYFVRIPDGATAGPHRLEFVVSDRVAGVSTQAHLDLEVRP